MNASEADAATLQHLVAEYSASIRRVTRWTTALAIVSLASGILAETAILPLPDRLVATIFGISSLATAGLVMLLVILARARSKLSRIQQG